MFKQRGEILIEACYSHDGGSRDITLCESFREFEKLLETLPARTLVNIYRQYDLSLRGKVDEELIQAVLTLLPNDADYLIVNRHPRNDWRLAAEYNKADHWLNSFQEGNGHSEITQNLRDTFGEEVAIGADPDWGKEYSN